MSWETIAYVVKGALKTYMSFKTYNICLEDPCICLEDMSWPTCRSIHIPICAQHISQDIMFLNTYAFTTYSQSTDVQSTLAWHIPTTRLCLCLEEHFICLEGHICLEGYVLKYLLDMYWDWLIYVLRSYVLTICLAYMSWSVFFCMSWSYILKICLETIFFICLEKKSLCIDHMSWKIFFYSTGC